MQTNPTYGAVVKFGDRVFHTDLTWRGGFSQASTNLSITPKKRDLEISSADFP